MSEKKPLEAAIVELREHADFCHHQWADSSKTIAYAEHYETKELEYIRAIRVLEAAGRVDKAELEWFANEVSHLVVDTGKGMMHGFEYRRAIKVIGSIRALLESLPEQGEEET